MALPVEIPAVRGDVLSKEASQYESDPANSETSSVVRLGAGGVIGMSSRRAAAPAGEGNAAARASPAAAARARRVSNLKRVGSSVHAPAPQKRLNRSSAAPVAPCPATCDSVAEAESNSASAQRCSSARRHAAGPLRLYDDCCGCVGGALEPRTGAQRATSLHTHAAGCARRPALAARRWLRAYGQPALGSLQRGRPAAPTRYNVAGGRRTYNARYNVP